MGAGMEPNETNQTLDRKLNCSSNGIQLVRGESGIMLARIVTRSTGQTLIPVVFNRWNSGRLLLSFRLTVTRTNMRAKVGAVARLAKCLRY